MSPPVCRGAAQQGGCHAWARRLRLGIPRSGVSARHHQWLLCCTLQHCHWSFNTLPPVQAAPRPALRADPVRCLPCVWVAFVPGAHPKVLKQVQLLMQASCSPLVLQDAAGGGRAGQPLAHPGARGAVARQVAGGAGGGGGSGGAGASGVCLQLVLQSAHERGVLRGSVPWARLLILPCFLPNPRRRRQRPQRRPPLPRRSVRPGRRAPAAPVATTAMRTGRDVTAGCLRSRPWGWAWRREASSRWQAGCQHCSWAVVVEAAGSCGISCRQHSFVIWPAFFQTPSSDVCCSFNAQLHLQFVTSTAGGGGGGIAVQPPYLQPSFPGNS